ncbi:MAG TPA: hydroxyphenylacetyl-CoA thioesterase PaaI [Alphaproteobacteria bacterium]|nr:hydroxyphenylacetyl-CoA thioesterase PaaI [Alphaproteobacteria bacterium]
MARSRADDKAVRVAEDAGRTMYERDRAARALGIALLDVSPGFARMSMTVRPDMVNGHATCHGGLVFTLADTAFAYSCNSHNKNAVAQHCAITFVQPAHAGDLLTAEAVEQSLSGRSGVYDIKVTNQKGETVALFRGNSRVIKGEVVAGNQPSPEEPS